MRRYHLAATLIMAAFSMSRTGPGYAILIDDFSIDQARISTGHDAAYDLLRHPDLFGGNRQMFVGGASIPGACSECEISAEINGGHFRITPGDDCPGAGNVTWGHDFSLGLNVFGDTGIELEVAEVTGIAWTRISIYSAGIMNDAQRLDVFLDRTGAFTIPFSTFPGAIALPSIDHIVVSTYLDVGEFIAFDSVRTIPEPSVELLVVIALVIVVGVRARR